MMPTNMTQALPPPNTRERLLEIAERLFSQRGYRAVTLRDIASEVGIRHASLYYYAPGGKEALFVEVTERNLQRHRAGIEQAIAGAGTEIRAILYAIADWLLSQPPMDLVRMVHSDMPAIEPTQAKRLSLLAFESLLSPVERALRQAQVNNEIKHDQLTLVAGGVVGMIESLHAVPANAVTTSRVAMAHTLIDTLLAGLRSQAHSA